MKTSAKLFFILLLTLLIISSSRAQSDTLLASGATWKYFTASLPSATWMNTSYNDAAWSTGPSELGWGEGDEATVVPSGPSGNRYSAYYFRRVLNISNVLLYRTIFIKIKRDDGAIVFINGNEVWRNNMPAGAPTYATLASASCADDGYSWITFTPSPGTFVNGNNTIAVEIHQNSITSSDVSFNLEVIARRYGSLNITRGPYLQMATDTSMMVRWKTDTASFSKVKYGLTQGIWSDSVFVNVNTIEHAIGLTGLMPNTRYYYTVGSGNTTLQGDTLNFFQTAPTFNIHEKTRIWVTGDCGTNYNTQAFNLNQVQNYLGTNYLNAWLLLGDNAYNAGTDSEYTYNFFEPYMSGYLMRQTAIFPAPGNHDYANSAGQQPLRNTEYYESFTLPTNGECGGLASGTEGYYSYNYSNIHFISLDSYGTESSLRLYDTTCAQVTWLKNDLANNTLPWTILYWHHPPYTKGSHNSDTESDLIQMREKLIRILDRYKVDLILCGHSHCYERSKLTKGHYDVESTFNASLHWTDSSSAKYDGSANSCPYIKDTASPTNEGIVYVVAGSAGKSGGTAAGWPHNMMQYSNDGNGGSFLLEIQDNRLDAKFISETGTLQDQFTILKNAGQSTNVNMYEGDSLFLSASWNGDWDWQGQSNFLRTLGISPIHPTTYVVNDIQNCVADTFFVSVTDTISPIFAFCPSPIQQANDSGVCTATVTWSPALATDNHFDQLTSTQNAGATFSNGNTLVTYSASDSSGNTATCSFLVTITDTAAPQFTFCPTNAIPVCEGTVSSFNSPTATDNCVVPTLIQVSGDTSGSVFPVGTNVVEFVSADSSGNQNTCSFVIEVNPNPTLTFTLSDTICLDANALQLSANPTGGTFSGSGVSSSVFNPSVAGLGTISISYSFTDSNGCNQSVSDSIRVVNCTIIGIASDEIENSFSLFPNPARNEIFVRWDDGLNLSPEFRLSDVHGKNVSFTLNFGINECRLNLESLPTGMYFIHIRHYGKEKILKFIKS